MKNWKQFTLIVFMAFLVFTFIGCGDDNGKKDPCNCNPKDHLAIDENCGCGLADCDCIKQIGYIDGIPVYKYKGISVEDMDDAVGKLYGFYTQAITENRHGDKGHLVDVVEIQISIATNNIKFEYNLDNIVIIRINEIDALGYEFFSGVANGAINPGFEFE